jgi:hypothetical protein
MGGDAVTAQPIVGDEVRRSRSPARLPRIHQRFLEIRSAIARETQWYTGKPEEYLSFGLQAANLKSSKLYKRAAETALRQGRNHGDCTRGL